MFLIQVGDCRLRVLSLVIESRLWPDSVPAVSSRGMTTFKPKLSAWSGSNPMRRRIAAHLKLFKIWLHQSLRIMQLALVRPRNPASV